MTRRPKVHKCRVTRHPVVAGWWTATCRMCGRYDTHRDWAGAVRWALRHLREWQDIRPNRRWVA